MTRHSRPVRWLDFDIENAPRSYWLPDRPTAEITAIASCWTDDLSSMMVSLLHAGETPEELLWAFLTRYNMTDGVTGHYIRKHDLPIINGALMEWGMPLLGEKLACDTKLDMMRKADIPATQEFLLETLHVKDVYGNQVRKYLMSQTDWRESNRLTPEGIAKTEARVKSDVFDHMLLRTAMLKAGMLRPPRMWDPGGAGSTPGHMGTGIG